MEPTDLNSREDETLAAFLQQPLPPLDDADFSVRTMRKLPLHPEERLRRLRWIFIGAGLLSGSAIAFVGIDWADLSELVSETASPALSVAPEWLTDPRLALGAAVSIGTCLYALLPDRSRSSLRG